MNRIFNKTTLITTLLCLVPIAIGTELQNKLPSEIPINYGFNNEARTLASKWIVIFLLPLILALVNLFVNLTLTEKNRQRIGKRLSAVLIWLVPLLSVVVSMFLILKPLGLPLKAGSLVFSIISVIFIIIGNYIPKCRPNSYVGYRLSWIMNDEELWMKTHRFSGFVLVIAGFASLVASFFAIGKYVFLVCLVIIIFVPLIYSLAIKKKAAQKN